MNKDAYYFSHDSNARNDEKCLYIMSKYGLFGYGLYWMFIECMHEQSDGKLACSLIDGFAFAFNTDITTLNQFYNDAITIGLFVTDGEKYWSDRVLRNKYLLEEKRAQKSQAGVKGMQSRWGNKNILKQGNNSVITKNNKGKESKVEEKENTGRFTSPTTEKISNYCLERKNDVDPERFHDFYEAKGWMVGKNKMKDWKAAIRTWEKKDKPTESIYKTYNAEGR